ncbi:MarR family winged helix-turn-helix transcriptional regulator [Microlunatus soli]|uniref:DNA-binding transcriptional regulator, MarR family n=1 Tax=Microlunatus soli TaxID=630515 RepID=A0A1H1N1Z0_9ACTN|nr:MarR family winged helix-turn-helix transcriptional regulator [Microlunatus soli]SDR92982.1 DNA-binding transcriptional regulator, MarR family [Microlunatus soli]
MAAGDSDDISMAVRRLLQSGRRMQSAAARRLGLRITDVQAMDLVTASGNRISPVDLADQLGIRTASASALIDRMVAVGHLERGPASRDAALGHRRRTNISATDAARSEVRDTLRDVNDGFRDLATTLSPRDAAVVLSFLERATEILQEYSDDAGAADRGGATAPDSDTDR